MMMMSNLSMVEAKLPPGFRFHPRDEELICDYLMSKCYVTGICSCDGKQQQQQPPLLIDVDLNKCEPWDIPETACVGGKEWYFYSRRDRKYAIGLRTNRATGTGYWKATGKDRSVRRKGGLVGMRKTLVFYLGRAPKGKKTDWVMHEFRLDQGPPKVSSAKEDWVLCRVFHKNGEVAAKQGMGRSYDDTSPSYLPPLMDPYSISCDQTQLNYDNNLISDQLEQVPCFSIFNPNQTNQTFSSHIITHNMDPNPSTISPTFGPIPPDVATYLNLNPSLIFL